MCVCVLPIETLRVHRHYGNVIKDYDADQTCQAHGFQDGRHGLNRMLVFDRGCPESLPIVTVVTVLLY